MFLKNKKSQVLGQAGFSLVELMIVVAIIGLLAAVGVPQYQKFQSRARQGEAKSALSSLYTSEQSFLGEWNTYSVDLKNIGFGVTGSQLRYNTGFTQTAVAGYAAASPNAPAEAGSINNSWSFGSGVNVGASPATFVSGLTPPVAVPIANACNGAGGAGTATAITTTTFTATAIGDPRNSPTAASKDQWTITQAKNLRNDVICL